ncbi:DUF262 domain-containing protein [Sphingobium yanoikuyae]|uniref:DUF262 domain-containing protein n=1 Tax=Sphingobium yanoikuyae TaxID=13690 RepID=A0A6P1GQL6_SPHYA|nr:DUF262 domain-containing protein [Sphingobium yanoikuyae]QHD69731.1 DUF262 domain-containing protein [Sphingobium yanoikuyae]
MTNETATLVRGAGGLCLKAVLEIEGHFYIPGYQRGYRWGPDEVGQLVKDIHGNLGRNYCLQPIVVKNTGNEWELVDGQQRLTTLHLLVRALGGKPRWALRYETREQSADFLAQPDAERARTNIDFHHIWQAEQAIEAEVASIKPESRNAMLEALSNGVRVIWYEAPSHVPSIDLFTRLNSGRIPLDDAELFKALLLSQTLSATTGYATDEERTRQLVANELAVQWDTIERDLRRPEIWAFLAGNRTCATHISLLLEIVAGVPAGDAAGTFRVFDELSKQAEREGASAVWFKVVQLYERMLGWYANRRQYHHIGFLIAQAGTDGRDKMLREIASQAASRRHSDFGAWLAREVRRRLNVARSDLTDLRYDMHHARIQRLLLLLNVETTARNKHAEARYPFAAHHADSWELEHIHAQNAPELNTAKQWEAWITVHEEAVQSLPNDEHRNVVLKNIEIWREANATDAAVGDAFRDLANEILTFLAGNEAPKSEDEVHGLGNLALLSKSVNIGLGNSAFEAKRLKIIAYDHEGDFVPACTRHVFLKYYSEANTLQPHFWSAKDRAAYLTEIEAILSDYLGEEAQP